MIVKNIDGVAMKVHEAPAPRISARTQQERTKKRLAVLAREGSHTYYWVRDTLRRDATTQDLRVKPIRPYWVRTYNKIFAKWGETPCQ